MVLSAGLAFMYPFELFLFVYAVLGPLHYVTEISWLHNKGYYTKGKYDYLFLLALGVIIAVFYYELIPNAPKGTVAFFTYLALVAALFFAITKSTIARFAGISLAAVVGLLLATSDSFHIGFGLFLPTLIHVYLFTGFFILAGALRGRSLSGFLSLLVFVGIAGVFVLFHPVHATYQVSDYVRQNYGYIKENGRPTSPFVGVNFYVSKFFHLFDFSQSNASVNNLIGLTNDFLYKNPSALALMSFISFAYTYHYFNWFSKTSIIRWHEISRNRFIVLLLIWGASLALYASSYSLGIAWLFFLSFVHELFEFPLNHLTVIGIYKEFRKMGSSAPQAVGNVSNE
jgi:hypothetical protein